MRRYRARINLGFGGLLVAIITPADQRREVLVVTILFGLTGAALLFTAGCAPSDHECRRCS